MALDFTTKTEDVKTVRKVSGPSDFAPAIEAQLAAWDEKRGRAAHTTFLTIPTDEGEKWLRRMRNAVSGSTDKGVRARLTESGNGTSVLAFQLADKIVFAPRAPKA